MKTYRRIYQWDQWLAKSLGSRLLEAERQFLPTLLSDFYGKQAVLIGVPHQQNLLKFSAIPRQVLVSPLIHKQRTIPFIEAEFSELPIASASIDLVLLPHTLEFIDNPRQLLSEACRIVKPEGYLIIFGFNPCSLWGLNKKWQKHPEIPWTGNFTYLSTLKKWLALAEFELVKHEKLLFRPPLQKESLYDKLKLLEWIGSHCWTPFGGVYMLMTKAKVIPLTPIRLHWEQGLSGVRMTVPRTNTRNI